MSNRRDRDPSVFAWSLALVSLILPWAGIAIALYGGFLWTRGEPGAWSIVAAGLVLVLLDMVVDLIWAQPSVLRSDEPRLNARAAQLVGRNCTVEEPITGGRGRARVGDTVWTVEGPDAPSGATLRIVGMNGTALKVALPDHECGHPEAP